MAGCLHKETTHTLYLAPDGAVTWMAVERDVRSDDRNPAARSAEETAYVAAVAAGVHPIRSGLAALGPLSERTQVLRAERPFIVLTEAQFAGIDGLVGRMLSDLGVPGRATLTRTGARATLTISVDVAAALADESERSTPVTDLLEDLARYRIVLTDGRFVAASRFRLSDDDTAAVPIEPSDDEIAARKGVLEFSLTWESGAAGH
jgi:hypothetical protein